MDTTTARRSEDGGGNSRSSAGKEKISWPSTQAIGEKEHWREQYFNIYKYGMKIFPRLFYEMFDPEL
jgi:hypothetical protein